MFSLVDAKRSVALQENAMSGTATGGFTCVFVLLNVRVSTSGINPRPAPGIVGTRFLPEGAPLSSEAFETMIGSGHVTGAAFMSSTLGPRSRYTPARQ